MEPDEKINPDHSVLSLAMGMAEEIGARLKKLKLLDFPSKSSTWILDQLIFNTEEIKESLYKWGISDHQINFKKYDDIYNFTLDPCATHENAKCDKYFTITDDGLSKSWEGERVFLNQPYNKPEQPCKAATLCKKKKCLDRGYHIDKYIPGQIDWVEKAFRESLNLNTIVVGLLPVRTDTALFHDYIYEKARIDFIQGRVKFVGGKSAAPFPSMIVVWGIE